MRAACLLLHPRIDSNTGQKRCQRAVDSVFEERAAFLSSTVFCCGAVPLWPPMQRLREGRTLVNGRCADAWGGQCRCRPSTIVGLAARPARFTVQLLDVPDQAASYELYPTALYQEALP